MPDQPQYKTPLLMAQEEGEDALRLEVPYQNDFCDVTQIKVAARNLALTMVYEGSKWHTWNGRFWNSKNPQPAEKIGEWILEQLSRCAALGNKKIREAGVTYYGRGTTLQSISRWTSALKEPMRVSADEFDADPFLLNTQNGTYNLKTHTLSEPDPAQMCSKITAAKFDPEAKCPQWKARLAEWFPDEDTRKAIQTAAGYSLLGHNPEHKMFFTHGGGGNGKSAFGYTLARVLGGSSGYSTANIKHRLVTKTYNASESSHDSDFAGLIGSRFAFIDETPENMFIHAERVKQISGSDTISVRKAHAPDPVEYPVTFTLWVMTNNIPEMSTTSAAISRRVVLFPSGEKIKDSSAIKGLAESLARTEGDGILQWLIEGLKNYQKNGLVTSKALTESTRSFKREEDRLGQFIEQTYYWDPSLKESILVSKVYKQYTTWCNGEGFKFPKGKHVFNKDMDNRGATRKRTRTERVWVGLVSRTKADRKNFDATGLEDVPPWLWAYLYEDEV